MGNELQSLSERIAERVGKDLVELIPKEQWDKLITVQVQKFLTEEAPRVINAELTSLLKQSLYDNLNSEPFREQWDNKAQVHTSTAVKELLEASAPHLFAAMLEPLVTGLVNDLKYRLQQ